MCFHKYNRETEETTRCQITQLIDFIYTWFSKQPRNKEGHILTNKLREVEKNQGVLQTHHKLQRIWAESHLNSRISRDWTSVVEELQEIQDTGFSSAGNSDLDRSSHGEGYWFETEHGGSSNPLSLGESKHRQNAPPGAYTTTHLSHQHGIQGTPPNRRANRPKSYPDPSTSHGNKDGTSQHRSGLSLQIPLLRSEDQHPIQEEHGYYENNHACNTVSNKYQLPELELGSSIWIFPPSPSDAT